MNTVHVNEPCCCSSSWLIVINGLMDILLLLILLGVDDHTIFLLVSRWEDLLSLFHSIKGWFEMIWKSSYNDVYVLVGYEVYIIILILYLLLQISIVNIYRFTVPKKEGEGPIDERLSPKEIKLHIIRNRMLFVAVLIMIQERYDILTLYENNAWRKNYEILCWWYTNYSQQWRTFIMAYWEQRWDGKKGFKFKVNSLSYVIVSILQGWFIS